MREISTILSRDIVPFDKEEDRVYIYIKAGILSAGSTYQRDDQRVYRASCAGRRQLMDELQAHHELVQGRLVALEWKLHLQLQLANGLPVRAVIVVALPHENADAVGEDRHQV